MYYADKAKRYLLCILFLMYTPMEKFCGPWRIHDQSILEWDQIPKYERDGYS